MDDIQGVIEDGSVIVTETRDFGSARILGRLRCEFIGLFTLLRINCNSEQNIFANIFVFGNYTAYCTVQFM
jgi:hypothetical protein